MKKSWLIILIAALCALVLAVTIWCVAGGIRSVMPAPEKPLPELTEPLPEVPEDSVVPLDPETGAPIVEDNTVVDPWGELEADDPIGSAPIEETPTEEEPEEEIDMEEWSTSDEGWTGIY